LYGVCATGGCVTTGAGPRGCGVVEFGAVIVTWTPVGFESNVKIESFDGFGSVSGPVGGSDVFVNADPVGHGT